MLLKEDESLLIANQIDINCTHVGLDGPLAPLFCLKS